MSFKPFNPVDSLKQLSTGSVISQIDEQGHLSFTRIKKGSIRDFTEFSMAFTSLAALYQVFFPTQAEGIAQCWSTFSQWHASGVPLALILQYFESVRYTHQASFRDWSHIDDNIYRTIVTNAVWRQPTKRPRSPTASSARRKRRISKAIPSPLSVDQRAKAFEAAVSNGLCAKFQFGICKRPDLHYVSSKDGPPQQVAHQCVHCNDGAHGLKDCPSLDSY